MTHTYCRVTMRHIAHSSNQALICIHQWPTYCIIFRTSIAKACLPKPYAGPLGLKICIMADLIRLFIAKVNQVMHKCSWSWGLPDVSHMKRNGVTYRCPWLDGHVVYSVPGTVCQAVYLDSTSSMMCSVIGPFCFKPFIKSFPAIAWKYGVSIHLYADDTQLYVSCDPDEADSGADSALSRFGNMYQGNQRLDVQKQPETKRW